MLFQVRTINRISVLISIFILFEFFSIKLIMLGIFLRKLILMIIPIYIPMWSVVNNI